MRARRFRKRVELWQTESYEDGYGGNLERDYLITTMWANISTLDTKSNVSLGNDLGVADRSNTIVITLRKRSDITYNSVNQFIKYSGYRYVIQKQPINDDFNNSYVTLLATRQQVDEVSELTPFDEYLPAYTNYVNRAVEDGGSATSDACLLAYVQTLF